ncbi:MAG: ComEC/Rec2 family competence protein [Planctomycetota bacterium]
MDLSDRRAPELPAVRAPAPALAAAGALAVGSAMGAVVAGRAEGTPLEAGAAAFVALLGLVAAWTFAPRKRRFPSRAVLVGLALAALAAARVAAAGVPAVESAGPGPAGDVVSTRRAPRGGARGTESWDLGPTGEVATLRAPAGVLRAAEVARVLASAERPARARGIGETAGRPLPRRPRADEIVRIAPSPSPHRASRDRPLASLREAGIERCLAHPERATAGLLAALLFGAPAHLPSGTADLFTRTGTRHLLALSGFHVGLLGVLIALPLARLGCALFALGAGLAGIRARPDPALATAMLALLFVPLAGSGAPATRAAIALSLALIAPRAGRRPHGANLLGVALAIEIALDPRAPLRPGLQLSYLATLALVLAAPRACRRALQALPNAGRVRRTSRSGRVRPALARALTERAIQGLAIGVTTSVVASAATLPIVWACFGEWSPVGLVATPLATAPLVVLVGVGWLWLVAPFALGEQTLALASSTLLGTLRLADAVPGSPLALPDRPILALAAGSTLMLVALAHPSGRAVGISRRAGAGVFAALLAPWPFGAAGTIVRPVRPRTLEVHVLDVGDGTCAIVRAPRSPTWILDAGSRDRMGVGVDAVGPTLRSLEVGRTRLALSHDHADHARDLPWTARRWPPDLWVGPRPTTREPVEVFVDPLNRVRRVQPDPGVVRLTEPSAPLDVRAVWGGDFPGNEGSALLDVRWRSADGRAFRAVLSGDAEAHGLAAMLLGDEDGPWLDAGPVDLLLLPHHGSDSPELGPLLDHLRPRAAVVSASAPPPAAGELARRGIPLHTTGRSGTLFWTP